MQLPCTRHPLRHGPLSNDDSFVLPSMLREGPCGIPDIETIDGYMLVPDERQWFFNYADSHPSDAGHRLYAKNLVAALFGKGR